MKRNFIYSFDGIIPSYDETGNLKGFAFNVFIDTKIAKWAFQKTFTVNEHDWMQERGREILMACPSFKNILDENFMPYSFVRNKKGDLTYLLQGIQTPGGHACDLSLDGSDATKLTQGKFNEVSTLGAICYINHNVTSAESAYALQNSFIYWTNIAE